jgi:hypothetical protein
MSHDDHTFDDDRLLAYAAGLDDDPELAAAAQQDAALRGRIEALRADVAAVTAGLQRVVPAPPEDYADLGDARWSEMRDLVAAPAAVAPRRRPAWLRVLVPVVAITVVLIAGVAGLQTLGSDAGDEAATVADDKAGESYDRQGGGQGEATTGSTDRLATPSPATASSVPQFETVVIARAEAPTAGHQDFSVLRVLKGQAGPRLTFEMIDRALAPGALAVLYCQPVGDQAAAPAPPGPTVSGTPPPNASAKAVRFSFDGAPAWARQLPPGTDPEQVAQP